MKIRNGFVSNSSSSSYVIAIPKDDFDGVVRQMDELSRRIITELCEDTSILGVDAKYLSYMDGEHGYIETSWLSKKLLQDLKKESSEGYDALSYMIDAMDNFGSLVEKHERGFYNCEGF